MRSVKPPATATWLLHRLGHTNDALTGDLMEEYLHGRSGAWYWRQVLFAVIVGFGKEVWNHKLLSLRALAVGWAAWYLLFYIVDVQLWRLYSKVLLTHGLTITVWWRHYYLYPTLLPWVFPAACGWIVGRCHRAHRQAMVILFFVSVQLPALPEFYRLTVDAFGDRRYLPYLLSLSLEFVCIAASVLVGGLWGASRERSIPSERLKGVSPD
jgi:hypothetical protein